jgi:hypothetical protein
MPESADNVWKEKWKQWSESRPISRCSWECIRFAKEYPELEERIFQALTNENRFLVANCLVVLEAMRSPKRNSLPPELFERHDRITLIHGSFAETATISQLARKIVEEFAATKGDFMFDGSPVGVFLETEYPNSPGPYRYEPYRSFAHYEVHNLLQKGEHPRCYYDYNQTRVNFTVRACPEYGVLELSDFDAKPP